MVSSWRVLRLDWTFVMATLHSPLCQPTNELILERKA